MASDAQAVTQIYQMIRQAIIDRNIVVATYHGYVREMCPHVIGKKNGRAQALFYQFAGESSSGLQPDESPANWRCLRIDELTDVSIKESPGAWHTAANYAATAQKCVGEIEAMVQLP
jgi:hypothetical protein